MGKLFVAIPFAPSDSVCSGGASEIKRLSIIIVIVGTLWCGFTFIG